MDIKYVYDKGIKKYQFSVFNPYTEMYYFTIFDTKESKVQFKFFKKLRNILNLKYYQYKLTMVVNLEDIFING